MTKQPHTCPRCEGEKYLGVGKTEPCPTCDATGVVWEPVEEAAATGPGVDDPRVLGGGAGL